MQHYLLSCPCLVAELKIFHGLVRRERRVVARHGVWSVRVPPVALDECLRSAHLLDFICVSLFDISPSGCGTSGGTGDGPGGFDGAVLGDCPGVGGFGEGLLETRDFETGMYDYV